MLRNAKTWHKFINQTGFMTERRTFRTYNISLANLQPTTFHLKKSFLKSPHWFMSYGQNKKSSFFSGPQGNPPGKKCPWYKFQKTKKRIPRCTTTTLNLSLEKKFIKIGSLEPQISRPQECTQKTPKNACFLDLVTPPSKIFF